MHYDLVVIGSGPAGQKAAIAAAKMEKSVVIIERMRELVGGVCLHTGTIPSKTIREAILYLTGYRHRDVYGESFRNKRNITMDDLRLKLQRVSASEWQVVQDQFARNNIELACGEATFVDPHTLDVQTPEGTRQISGERILIATGTKPARPDHIPFDGESIFDSDEMLDLKNIPRSMIVVGAGVIGIEYAIMYAALGVHVTVIDGRERLLDFCDREIVDTLMYQARGLGMVFRLGEDVTEVAKLRDNLVGVQLESGKRLLAEAILFSVGRQGDTEHLGLEHAGLQTDKRGRLKADDNFQTEVPHIYAVGDIVGFPCLASASMEQGRRAAHHAFGQDFAPTEFLPYGLFTIPEISMVGKTEEQLTSEHVPYEVGIARYSEIARGHIVGDRKGILKLLFHRESKKLLAVHCIGESATEIVHIGQTVMAHDGTIDYFSRAVFNYPTMAECYKVAALDGLNKLALADRYFGSGAATVTEEIDEISAALEAVDC